MCVRGDYSVGDGFACRKGSEATPVPVGFDLHCPMNSGRIRLKFPIFSGEVPERGAELGKTAPAGNLDGDRNSPRLVQSATRSARILLHYATPPTGLISRIPVNFPRNSSRKACPLRRAGSRPSWSGSLQGLAIEDELLVVEADAVRGIFDFSLLEEGSVNDEEPPMLGKGG